MKYMGSKARLSKNLAPIIQSYIDKNNVEFYIEPFVGGANMIDKIKCENRIGYDKSKELIALLNHAKESTDYPEDIPKNIYDSVRTSFNKNDNTYSDTYKGIVGYLASCKGRFFDGGYSGTRIGKDGKVNVYFFVLFQSEQYKTKKQKNPGNLRPLKDRSYVLPDDILPSLGNLPM